MPWPGRFRGESFICSGSGHVLACKYSRRAEASACHRNPSSPRKLAWLPLSLSLCMCRALAPAFRSLPPFALCWFVPVWARNPGLVTGPLAASQRTVRASCACVAGRSEVPVPCDATASHAMAPADVSVICHQQLHHRRDLLPRRREAAALTAWHRKLGRLDGD
jgi:hypothetical protein